MATTIVVLGGGAAGANVIKGLVDKLDSTQHRLVLITARPQYVNLLGSLRLLVNKNTPYDRVFMTYDHLFRGFPGEIKFGTATSIEETKGARGGIVTLDSGESVPYHIIVLATGSVWEGMLAFPDEPDDYTKHVESWRNKFRVANEIIIVGGGPVAVETAGEIKDIYPSKKVTIVQGDRLLLNDVYPDKFRIDIQRRLEKRGVEIILNDAIKGNPPTDAPIKTREGKELTCDLLVIARGGGANTKYLTFLRPSPLTERGYIKVNPTLEVQYHPGMFALGDIVDWPEVKQLAKISMGHAAIVVKNVLKYLNNEELTNSYRGTRDIMAISIGKNGGGSYLGLCWGLVFGDRFTKRVKSHTLLIEKVNESLGIVESPNTLRRSLKTPQTLVRDQPPSDLTLTEKS